MSRDSKVGSETDKADHKYPAPTHVVVKGRTRYPCHGIEDAIYVRDTVGGKIESLAG